MKREKPGTRRPTVSRTLVYPRIYACIMIVRRMDMQQRSRSEIWGKKSKQKKTTSTTPGIRLARINSTKDKKKKEKSKEQDRDKLVSNVSQTTKCACSSPSLWTLADGKKRTKKKKRKKRNTHGFLEQESTRKKLDAANPQRKWLNSKNWSLKSLL